MLKLLIPTQDYRLTDAKSIAKAVKHSNVVINLVGRDYETRNFKFSDVHVDGARLIAEAAQEAGVKRLIHFSALNANVDSPSKFLQSKVSRSKGFSNCVQSLSASLPSFLPPSLVHSLLPSPLPSSLLPFIPLSLPPSLPPSPGIW